MLPLPDLLHLEPHLAIDRRVLEEVLGMAALGRQLGTEFHDLLAAARVPPGAWSPDFFAEDLFLEELISSCCTLELDGRSLPVNHRFLRRVLSHVPGDLETIRFRQAIVREIDERAEIRDAAERLYLALFDLASLHKTPSYQAHVDVAAFHLDILRQAQVVIDLMADAFSQCASGLARLHQSAAAIQKTEVYSTLAALLDYEQHLARLELEVTIGGDGRIRDFAVRKLQENAHNPFFRTPLRRLFDRCRLMFNGYPMSNRELMNRLITEVFRRISPHFVPLVQLIGHLEFYLTARGFRERARRHGLDMVLAEFVEDGAPLGIERLFNPLLLGDGSRPVPCDLGLESRHPITVITGPNSGGKTRLLQSLGLLQLLGQSGLYVPAARARLRVARGLFVSLVEDESADQTEGRLGRELVRIRSLFEETEKGSMIILDELCSGTNPSEGIEVFEMVLRLLRDVEPIAFVTTHFLDFARSLQGGRLGGDFEFRQVEVDQQQRSTYQFVDGVAETSLASVTAQRLGVTFERLSEIIRSRTGGPPEGSDRISGQAIAGDKTGR